MTLFKQAIILRVFCVLGTLLLTTAGITGCKDADAKPAATPQQAVPVSVTTAEKRDVQRSVLVPGTLFGEQDVVISNKVPGKVIAIFKDVGDRATIGETLAQLLQADYQLAVNQRKSALSESLAKLGLKDLPADDFNPSTLPAARQAKLQADNAQQRYLRGKELHDQKPPLMSDQDFADLTTARDVARSAYDVEVLTGQALIAEARTRAAELRIAEQAFADTTIKAPRPFGENSQNPPPPDSFAVAERHVEVGELLSALTPMFRLVDDDPLKLRPDIPERFVGEVKVGQKVNVSVAQYPEKPFSGTVSRINPQIDPTSRTFKAEILVENPTRDLRAGGFAQASISTRTEPAIFVPKSAIARFAGVEKVFTIKDGKAEEIRVRTGDAAENDWIEITQGLKGGEQIVTKNADKLATGTPVEVGKE